MRQLAFRFDDHDEPVGGQEDLQPPISPSPAELEAIRLDEEEQALARLMIPEERQRHFARLAAMERARAREGRSF